MKVLFLLLLLSVPAFGQTVKCTLDIKKAPVFRGISLQMAPTALAPMFTSRPTVVDDSILISDSDRVVGFDNVKFASIGVYEGKIYNIYLEYAKIPFRNAREFARNLSDNFALPYESWIFTGDSIANLLCNGFHLTIREKVVMLGDAEASERRQQAINKAFKP